MATVLVYLTLGLGGGAFFATLGVSASLTHRASGVMNLAIGSMAMIPALTYNALRTRGDLVLPVVGPASGFHLADHLPVLVSVGVAVAVGTALYLLALVAVFHPMRDAPAVTKAVASLGIALFLDGMGLARFGTRTRATPALLTRQGVHLLGRQVPADRLAFAAIAIGIAVACASWLRWSRSGLVLRAAADNFRGSLLLGFSPLRSAATAWAVAGAVTSLAAVALTSIAAVAPPQFALYTVPALGAALAGRMRSLGVVCATGLAIGALQALAVHLGAVEALPRVLQHGFDDALPLVAIVVALSMIGRSIPGRGTVLERRHPDAALAPRPRLWIALAVAGLSITWFGSSELRLSLVQSAITAVLALSMVVSAGYIGQVSLAQVTIAGLAAFILAGFATGLHLPFPLSPILAVVCAGGIGFVVGIPALRIRGAQLMVVSLAFAVAANRLILENPQIAGATYGVNVPPPRLGGIDLGVFGPGGFPAPRSVTVVVVATIATFVAVGNLRRSRTGRRWLAVRGNERAAAAAGVDVVGTKLLASAVSVALAGVAGVLIAYNTESVSYRLFETDIALALLALAYLGGIASIVGALIAGLLASGGLFERVVGIGAGKQGHSRVYGLALIAVTLFSPGGIAGAFGPLRRSASRATERATMRRSARTGVHADGVVGSAPNDDSAAGSSA